MKLLKNIALFVITSLVVFSARATDYSNFTTEDFVREIHYEQCSVINLRAFILSALM
ncbi:MAG: hypothetical protein ACI9TY_001128 [Alphaproteobacteria bacterium]|jgi:hypothetical protein